MSNRLGLEFLTPPGQLTVRMLAPLGGIALVELDLNPQELLLKAGDTAELLLPDTPSEKSHYWYYDPKDEHENKVRERENFAYDFPELTDIANDVTLAMDDVFAPLFEATEWVSTRPQVGFFAQRRVKFTDNHYDADTFTAWFGASAPGLSINVNGVWVPVDNVPPGHALLWRGPLLTGLNEATGKIEPLPAIRHKAVYRSKQRRHVLLGWD